MEVAVNLIQRRHKPVQNLTTGNRYAPDTQTLPTSHCTSKPRANTAHVNLSVTIIWRLPRKVTSVSVTLSKSDKTNDTLMRG